MKNELRSAYDKDDAKLIAALADEIYSEHYSQFIEPKHLRYIIDRFQSEEVVLKQMNDGTIYYIIMIEGEPCGYFAVELNEPEGKLFLSKIYIRSSARGNKLSTLAINKMISIAEENNLKSIWLRVNKLNRSSQKIYESLRFKTIGTDTADIGGGYVMDDYIMEREI